MTYTLKDIAVRVDGKIIGDASVEVRGAAPFDMAAAGDITFALDPKYLKRIEVSPAAAV